MLEDLRPLLDDEVDVAQGDVLHLGLGGQLKKLKKYVYFSKYLCENRRRALENILPA